jgi:ABC-2 type transport system permease protein
VQLSRVRAVDSDHSVDSATPIVQAITLPLYFVSGVFVPTSTMPAVVTAACDGVPVEHLASGFQHALDPPTDGSGFP